MSKKITRWPEIGFLKEQTVLSNSPFKLNLEEQINVFNIGKKEWGKKKLLKNIARILTTLLNWTKIIEIKLESKTKYAICP